MGVHWWWYYSLIDIPRVSAMTHREDAQLETKVPACKVFRATIIAGIMRAGRPAVAALCQYKRRL
jgi:hypothetical protein